MIDDMASLKQAMEQMDAEDVAVAEAAKDRAARILSDSKLSFSKMAELIEQRRLLLRPRIVTSIKRMDQPDMLGDAAFRDTGASLRREGQSFRQIAEALELSGGTTPRYEGVVQKGDVLHPMEMESELGALGWPRALTLALRIAFLPLRHPIRFLVIALLAFMLFNTLRGFVGVGRQVSGYVADVSAARQRADSVMSSVSSFFEKWIMRRSQEAEAPSTGSSPVPSSSPANSPPAAAAAPPVTAAAPSTNEPVSEGRSSNGATAHHREHDARRNSPQFPAGRSVYRRRRRLLLGRWSVLTFRHLRSQKLHRTSIRVASPKAMAFFAVMIAGYSAPSLLAGARDGAELLRTLLTPATRTCTEFLACRWPDRERHPDN